MPTVTTSLGTVSYTDAGDGPPVLLLHANLHDGTDYAPVLDGLTRGRRVHRRRLAGARILPRTRHDAGCTRVR